MMIARLLNLLQKQAQGNKSKQKGVNLWTFLVLQEVAEQASLWFLALAKALGVLLG